MGTICQSCDSLLINQEQEKTKDSIKQPEIVLPKQYVDIPKEETETEEIIPKNYYDKSPENEFLKNKSKSVNIESLKSKNKDNKDIKIKAYLKSKTMKIIDKD